MKRNSLLSLVMLSISLGSTNLVAKDADPLKCIVSINPSEPKIPLNAKTFNLAVSALLNPEAKNGIPADAFSLIAQGKMTAADLQADMKLFYETYRANRNFLEEYSTEENRKTDPFPITRYHGRNRWLADAIMLAIKHTPSSAEILRDMAQINQWIIYHKSNGLPDHKTITNFKPTIIGTPQTRTAVYLQLRLQNKTPERTEVLRLFDEINSLPIKSDEWPHLDEIVLRSRGKVTYKDAFEFVRRLKDTSSLNPIRNELSSNSALVFKTLWTRGLPLTSESVGILESEFQQFQQKSGDKSSLLTFLHFFRVAPPGLGLSDLLSVIEYAKDATQKIQLAEFKRAQLSPLEAITLIYLNALPIINNRPLLQADLMEKSLQTYNSIFRHQEINSYIVEEYFLKSLNP